MTTAKMSPGWIAPSGNRRSARNGNVELVLDVLRTDGPSSQATVARRTGLSRATVNNIVKALRNDGVAEVRPINGRESLVSLVSKQGTMVAVQVGFGAVHGTAFAFEAAQRHDGRIDSDQGESEPAMVVDLVRSLAAKAGVEVADLAGVAVSMQAPIDRSTGAIASWSSNRLARWRDVPLVRSLSDALGVRVVVENDANLAALAEWTWGAGRGSNDFLYVACSEGVGGGLIIDGKLHRGGNGMAGEIGHIVLDESGAVCFCGSRGCLSTLTNERAILLALGASDSPTGSLQEVIDTARLGDPACQRVLFEAGRHLGRALGTIAKVMAPSVIAIGGTLGEAGDLVLDSLHTSIEVNNLRVISPSVRFRAAEITEDATLLGGVAVLLTELGQGVSELPTWMRTPTHS
jgi:predicted NBD/HSP70 family sugar kinase